MKKILRDTFGKNTLIDKILSGELEYSKLTSEQQSLVYGEGWHLLVEYSVNLSNIYKDAEEHSDVLGIFYSFWDKKNKLHYTRINKDATVKIGPAADNSKIDGMILTQKNRKFNDIMLLNTHVSNIIKYINKYKPKELVFKVEVVDGRGESRKRLFVSIAGQMHHLLKDIKVYGDVVILYLTYDNF